MGRRKFAVGDYVVTPQGPGKVTGYNCRYECNYWVKLGSGMVTHTRYFATWELRRISTSEEVESLKKYTVCALQQRLLRNSETKSQKLLSIAEMVRSPSISKCMEFFDEAKRSLSA